MAGRWHVSLVRSAKAELDGLPSDLREEAIDAITDLAVDPFPSGSAPMQRNTWYWRLKFDERRWRIVYRVDEPNRTVTVFRIRPRKTAYQGMRNPLS